MKKLLIALTIGAAIISPAASALIVIGDSISSGKNSWPSHYRDNTGENVKVLAQSGRRASRFQIPPDLEKNEHDTVVYFLGTNDVLEHDGFAEFKRAFTVHMAQLKAEGFRVVLILPVLSANHRPGTIQIRDYIANYSRGLRAWGVDIPCLDPMEWNYQTWDGLHPTRETSATMAYRIGEVLK